YDGFHLTEALSKVVSDERILFPRSNLSSNYFIDVCRSRNIEVDAPFVYETIYNTSNREKLNQIIKSNQVDIITFTSPS
ncbi:uroporphyrinogen-III synthase, partial [Pseudomonas sp. 2822-17]|uniref:uroporphyrinogen-III synthase n=1 Tax=Pseudomonas sp. 2822-17 TaxID=1712678 RepID=UPI0015AC1E26